MQSLSHSVRTIFRERMLAPILNLLREGTSPRRLAWSLAIGLVIGINPLLGSTTFVCLAAALLFRLNLIASQIANHVVYPLELALFFVFIRIGDWLFHTGRMPMHRKALLESVRHHPWDTTRLLWSWEWHALVVWLFFAAIVAPLLAAILTPVLRRMSPRQSG
jgi:uncharacterized protein (DUF2062 family)